MESAGLFAAAQANGKAAASIFVVGDSLAGPSWSAPPDIRTVHVRLKRLLDPLVLMLETLN
jgi:purine-nucleoside phosphorylase